MVTPPLEVVMIGMKNTHTSTIRNPDKNNNAYVKLKIEEIDYDSIARGDEIKVMKEVESSKDNLISRPNKFIVPPGGASNIKLIYTGELSSLTKDRYYRVTVTPLNSFEALEENAGKDVKSGIFFSISRTFYVVVNSGRASLDYVVSEVEGGYEIKNSGSKFFTLDSCNVCRISGCSLKSQIRMIPNRSVELNLPTEINTEKVKFSCFINDGLSEEIGISR